MAISGKSVCMIIAMMAVLLSVATWANGDNSGKYDPNAPENKAGQWDEEKWGWKKYEKNGGGNEGGGKVESKKPAATEEQKPEEEGQKPDNTDEGQEDEDDEKEDEDEEE